jgi:hypothetical protein
VALTGFGADVQRRSAELLAQRVGQMPIPAVLACPLGRLLHPGLGAGVRWFQQFMVARDEQKRDGVPSAQRGEIGQQRGRLRSPARSASALLS